MRSFNILTTLCFLIVFPGCQTKKPIPSGFEEAGDPEIIPTSAWQATSPGLHIAFGSCDVRYSRSLQPDTALQDTWNGLGWKGERISTKLLLWNKSDIGSINISMGILKNQKGTILDSSITQIHPIGYVLTDEFLTGCGTRENDSLPSHLVPDILLPNQSFNIPACTVRPVWISVNIPGDASPGVYRGLISVTYPKDTLQIPYTIQVQPMKLPDPSNWYFHLDLWQNPFAVARIHQVPLWSQQHWDLVKPLLMLLADAGQKCITTSIVPRPWGGQTYDPFGSMIEWFHNSSGKWEYDYSVFDHYVQTAMECGITEQINCYSMVPWGNHVTYFEEDSSRLVTVKVVPGTIEYEDLWRPFLYDFRAHLREMGWLEKTTIALDERGMKEMEALITFLKKTTPELKIAMAGHYFKEINPDLYDFSYNWRHISGNSPNVANKRRRNGKLTTYYVACGIPEPNNFTFSSPAESTYEGWFAAAMGLDGFLRWAYNSWPEDPLRDSRFRTWPAGDTYFVYPGALSSVRFEKLREGIQDYEKIRIISNLIKEDHKLQELPDSIDLPRFMEELNLLTLETHSASEMVNRGKVILSKLTDYFSGKQ